MKRIFTIEVEVRDDDRVEDDDRADEFEHWTGQVRQAMGQVTGQFKDHQERANDRVDWQAIDLTTIDIRERN